MDESFSFPSHEGLLHSCRRSTCAGRRRRPHPVVLKVTRAVAVLRDGGAWPAADPAPAQLLPFRRCRGVCAPKTCSLHVCVTFHCGDVPTFYAKFSSLDSAAPVEFVQVAPSLSYQLWLSQVILPGWSCSNSSASPKVPIKIQYHTCVHLHGSEDACFHLTVLFLVCLYNKAFLIT